MGDQQAHPCLDYRGSRPACRCSACSSRTDPEHLGVGLPEQVTSQVCGYDLHGVPVAMSAREAPLMTVLSGTQRARRIARVARGCLRHWAHERAA
jgi:hypothetical protein